MEFQTGHALWALAAAGIPADQPQVQKAIQYLLHRQQPFGGWMDPLQSFENFKTPFRETQFAVLALSHVLTRSPDAREGMGLAGAAIALRATRIACSTELDALWDRPSDGGAAPDGGSRAIERGAGPPGRRGSARDGWRCRRPCRCWSSCWRIRASWCSARRRGACARSTARTPRPAIANCWRRSPPRAPRMRWGATRVFAHHFAALARRDELVTALARPGRRPCARHPPAGDPRPVAGVVLERRRSDCAAGSKTRCWPDSRSRSIPGSKPICAPPSITWPTRISATSITTGWPCSASRRTATARFRGGWRWNRSSPSSSPACWSTGPTRRRSSCWRRWPNCRCAAATSTI